MQSSAIRRDSAVDLGVSRLQKFHMCGSRVRTEGSPGLVAGPSSARYWHSSTGRGGQPLGVSVLCPVPAVFGRRRARGGVNTQRPQREARGRTVLRPSRGRRTHSVRRRRRHVWLWWSASDSVDRVGGRRSCEPFLRGGACMKPCGRPRLVRGREATQLVDRTRGWVMALAGLHEVLVIFAVLVMLVMPRPW